MESKYFYARYFVWSINLFHYVKYMTLLCITRVVESVTTWQSEASCWPIRCPLVFGHFLTSNTNFMSQLKTVFNLFFVHRLHMKHIFLMAQCFLLNSNRTQRLSIYFHGCLVFMSKVLDLLLKIFVARDGLFIFEIIMCFHILISNLCSIFEKLFSAVKFLDVAFLI